jgi:hypothetical protein
VINITLSYRPISFIPLYRKISREFPESFQELSQQQFIAASALFEKKNLLIHDKIDFVRSLLSIKRRFYFLLEDYQVHELIKLLNWIHKLAFDRVFIQSFQVKNHVFYGPKDGLQNVIFDEFAHLDTYFARYLSHEDPADLHKMIASIYRPGRDKFDYEKIDDLALTISKCDPEISRAILFNYKVLRRWLETLYPVVFPAALPDEQPTAEQKPEAPKWAKVRRLLAGGDLASVENIGRLPLHTVLSEINDRLKDKNR